MLGNLEGVLMRFCDFSRGWVIYCSKFDEVKLIKLVRSGITLRRLRRDSYLSTNCIIVSCRSFRVLTKALFQSVHDNYIS